MSRLTDQDWERIRAFAREPRYKREPEMLEPDALSDAKSEPDG